MRSDHREVFHALRRTSVRYVHGDFDVVADVTRSALEGAGQTRFGKREGEGEPVDAPREYGDRGVDVLLPPNDLALVHEILVVFHGPPVPRHQHLPFHVGLASQKSADHYETVYFLSVHLLTSQFEIFDRVQDHVSRDRFPCVIILFVELYVEFSYVVHGGN